MYVYENKCRRLKTTNRSNKSVGHWFDCKPTNVLYCDNFPHTL